MEYLSITGSVRLKSPIKEGMLAFVIRRLQAIKFDRVGSAVIDRKNDVLTIEAEGEIADEDGIEVVFLLRALSLYTSDSTILISRVRWEINVTLLYQQDNFMPVDVFKFFNEQQKNQLLFL